MKCDNCGENIEVCDNCKNGFEVGDEVYCDTLTTSHYCSATCHPDIEIGEVI